MACTACTLPWSRIAPRRQRGLLAESARVAILNPTMHPMSTAFEQAPFWMLAHIGFDPSGTLIWVGVAVFAASTVTAACAALLLQRARALERSLKRLDALGEIQAVLSQLAKAREEMDLRRIEHALLDVRTGLKRTEDAMLRVVERPRETGAPSSAGAVLQLPERLTNRLLALGYERVQISSTPEQLEQIGERGEILVEARRDGALWKGHAVVEQGALTHLELKPVYSLFP